MMLNILTAVQNEAGKTADFSEISIIKNVEITDGRNRREYH